MVYSDIIEQLKALILSMGISKKDIEVELGLAKNSLSNILSGKRKLPVQKYSNVIKFITDKSIGSATTVDNSELISLRKENAELKKEVDTLVNKLTDLLLNKKTSTPAQPLKSIKNGWDGVSLIDFGNDKILNKENYTLYPKEYALKGFEKTEYYNLKKISDAIIVTQWEAHKKSIL